MKSEFIIPTSDLYSLTNDDGILDSIRFSDKVIAASIWSMIMPEYIKKVGEAVLPAERSRDSCLPNSSNDRRLDGVVCSPVGAGTSAEMSLLEDRISLSMGMSPNTSIDLKISSRAIIWTSSMSSEKI